LSKRDLLLEIGTEEMPARFIAGAAEQLKEKVEKWLQTERIEFDRIDVYETPRRLALLAYGVAEKQADRNEEAKGPARKIAQDEAGSWTKAALGFARSNGVEPEALYFKEVNGVEYVYARKNEIGKETIHLLPVIQEIIEGMTFPKNMRWGAHELKWARPIRWLVFLYGNELVEIEIAGVKSGRTTRGHRFLGEEISIDSPATYVQQLESQHVIVQPAKRKEWILTQLQELEKEHGWHIPIDEGLLEEVVHLVEYPTVLYGSFDPAFLQIPREVLITSMREHQRYFPVENEAGALQPHFVTVRNGDTRSLDVVAKGNEKVLRARLSDARFFYEEDQKLKIDDCLKRLETIVFHEELGTIGDKVRRIGKISAQIAARLGLGPSETNHVDRIARIAKFDLVTNMVNEFPELQGVMGEDYARKAGEPEVVARGIFEHYLPRYAGDHLPLSAEGAVVSVADKLDTIVGCFSIGIVPTGSADPYGLRRMAAGIVHILLDRGWKLPLTDLWEMALAAYGDAAEKKRTAADTKRDLADFFALRLKNVLQDEQVRYDIIDAVLAADMTVVPEVQARAKALMSAVQTEDFKLTVEQFNRVNNLAQKAEGDVIDPALFQEKAEHDLHQAFLSASQTAAERFSQGELAEALQVLSGLREPIRAFFDSVMVMAEDERVRRNRLALLKQMSRLIYGYADFAKIVFA
jgi:glycyl-tRNA synthetase beta chain